MITLAQSRIMNVLLDGPCIREELRPKSGIYGTQFINLIARLIKKDYVLDEKIEGVKTKLLTITQEGKKALRRFERGEVSGKKVEPITTSKMSGVYKTPTTYYRNNGNVHIPSLGNRC
jgi:DNA-binding MarR family transcriptional regulator